MNKLFILGFLSFSLLGCHRTTPPQATFAEPEQEQCYQTCLISYKGTAEGAQRKCFRVATQYSLDRGCFGGHGL